VPLSSKVEVVVLGLLAEEPSYGYDLLDRFRARSLGSWVEVSKASVYQVLKRLERDGLVTGTSQEGTDGPDRRVYRIAKAGRDRLRRALMERAAAAGPYETDAGIALGFGHLLPAADARKAVDARERTVREAIATVDAELARAASDRSAGRPISDSMLQQQRALATSELAWLKTYRAALGKVRR
jgi:DNA-binding PadR family transcriptional regulator